MVITGAPAKVTPGTPAMVITHTHAMVTTQEHGDHRDLAMLILNDYDDHSFKCYGYHTLPFDQGK